jgi:Abortive infection alpha
MKEESKAVQEVAKTAGKCADLVDRLGGFFSKVVGGTCNQLGGILEDWTKYYRYKNLLTISDKVEALHHRRKIEGKTVALPFKIAIPLLEAASLEDDVTLQDMWAGLIANGMDPGFQQPIHPSYIEIVKQMSPDEAVILNAFRHITGYPLLFTYHSSQKTGWCLPRGILDFGLSKDFGPTATYEKIYLGYIEWCKQLPLKSQNDTRLFLDNLLRMQLLELGYDLLQSLHDSPFLSQCQAGAPDSISDNLDLTLERDEYLKVTAYGEGFITACRND